jgi:hypothetical protein
MTFLSQANPFQNVILFTLILDGCASYRHWMEVSGQLLGATAFPRMKKTPICTERFSERSRSDKNHDDDHADGVNFGHKRAYCSSPR